jgi:hypothetical protein
MFKTVSIIPGIENFAPDRQDTSSGLVGSPNRLSRTCSTSCRAVSTCSHTSAGMVLSSAR